MNSLENKAELLALKAELAALKAEVEKDLKRWACPTKLNAVRSVFNGHPMSRKEISRAVWSKYPGLNVSERQISTAVHNLSNKKEIRNAVGVCNQWKKAMFEKV